LGLHHKEKWINGPLIHQYLLDTPCTQLIILYGLESNIKFSKHCLILKKFLSDLHNKQATKGTYIPNPYSFVGLVCPSKSGLKGFEKINIISGGILKISFCMICSSFEAEFSLCAPEDNDEIAQSIYYNALVVPNSTCLTDSKQNDSA